MGTFLDPEDIAELTGCKLKARQIEQLRKMGLPFWVNAAGRPVVPRSAIDGQGAAEQDKGWTPKPLRHAA
jgi:hypothetical protein